MKLSINEFEPHVDKIILKRGLSYFKNGAILDFTEISYNEFEAIVLGSEEYVVQLEIKNNFVTEHSCDCPFDSRPICKHIVEVLFFLQQEKLKQTI